jgi:hypothetical protein
MLYTNAIRPQQTEPPLFISIMLLISLASEAHLSSVRIKAFCANLDYPQMLVLNCTLAEIDNVVYT